MSVLFRFRFNGPDASRRLDTYKDKWRELMRYVFKIHRGPDTYERLNRIHEWLPRDSDTSHVLEIVQITDEDAARLLMDTAPLFDIAPYDFKVFILAVLGCEPSRLLDTKLHQLEDMHA